MNLARGLARPIARPIAGGLLGDTDLSQWLPTKPVDGSLPDLWMRPDTGVATSGARQFTAANSECFTLADNAALSVTTSDVSISFHFYTDTITGNAWIVSKGAASTTGYGVARIGNVIRGEITLGASVITFDSAAIVVSRWYHVIVEFDRDGNGTVYLDGVAGTPVSIAANAASIDEANAFTVGAHSGLTDFYGGRLARLVLAKRLWTSAEKTFLFNSGEGRLYGEIGIAGTDGADLKTSLISYWNLNEGAGNAIDAHSTNDLTDTNTVTATAGPMESIAQDSIGTNDGTLIGMDSIGAWSSDVPAAIGSGYSLKFDGTDDYVATPYVIDTAADFTVSIWGKPVGLAAGGFSLITQGAGSSTGWYINASGVGNADLSLTTNGISAITATGVLAEGVFVHVAVTFTASSNTLEMFVNNVSAGTYVFNLSTTSVVDIGRVLYLSTYYYQGNGRKLDDARIYSTVLSPSQRAELYAGSEATGAVPVAHWTFDDGPQSQLISDGDPIVTTESKEGNRYQFHQITGSKRPIYVANGINGQPGIQFDGVDDLLVCASAILAGTAGTVVIVYRLAAVPDSYQTLLSSSDEASTTRNISLLGRGNTANNHVGISQVNADTVDLLDGDTIVEAATDYVGIFSSNGTTTKAWLNGVAQVLTADTGANNGDWFDDSTAKDNVAIGALKTTSESAFLSAIVCDIIKYPITELSESGHRKIASYVETRYGIAAP